MKSTKPTASTFSVSQGYKARRISKRAQKIAEPRVPKTNPVENEILKFLTDEIVCATIDTMRVFAYLRAGLVGEARVRAAMRNYSTQDYDLNRDGMSPAEQRA